MTLARAPVLLLLCALIPMIVVAGVAGYYFTLAQRNVLEEAVRDTAEHTALAIAEELSAQLKLLTILSESPRLDPPLDVKEFMRLGERLRLRVPAWQMVRVTAPDGTVELTVPPSSMDGSDRKVIDIESHDELVATGKPIIGSVRLGPRGLPAFPVRVAVIRNGSVVYGLTSIIRPETLANVIHRNGIPASWAGWIADGEGRLVVSTFAGQDAATKHASEFVTVDVAEDSDLMPGKLADGTELRVRALAIPGTDWTLNVGMPAAAYLASFSKGLTALAAAAVLAFGLSVLAVYLFIRELGARRRDEATLASWQRVDALGKLTGGIAHDFNNLLMVFQGASEGIRRRPDDVARTSRLLDGMAEAVARGRALTQRLLSYSRRSNHDAVPVRIPHHLPDLRDSLLQAGQDLVDLAFEIPPDLWPVNIDPQSLETALINLVTNSREAMPSGGKIVVSARNVAELRWETKQVEGPGIAISVADEGAGIAPEDIARIYEPFYSTKEGSPGLGLSQVAAFARRSGGSLGVNSVQDRGAVFTVYLPRADLADIGGTAADAAQLPSVIMVVDDTPSSRAVAQMSLEDAGVRVVTAGDGTTALALLAKESVEGVLTDIRMPGMSGLELLERIRAVKPELPVVLMTGFSEAVEQGHYVDVPILRKTFTTKELVNAFSDAAARVSGTYKLVPLRRQ